MAEEHMLRQPEIKKNKGQKNHDDDIVNDTENATTSNIYKTNENIIKIGSARPHKQPDKHKYAIISSSIHRIAIHKKCSTCLRRRKFAMPCLLHTWEMSYCSPALA